MITADRTPGRDADGAGPALWFGLLGGAAAWAVQFLAGYLISEGSCVAAAGAVNESGALSGASLSVLLVSLAAFVVAVLAALSGRRVWLAGGEEAARAGPGDDAQQAGETRRHAHGEPGREPHGGSRWVGLAGFMLSGVFAFVIAVQVLPLFIGGGCA